MISVIGIYLSKSRKVLIATLDFNKATLQELSNELKVSVERVRQIETSSLKKIKEMILHGQDSGTKLITR